MIKVLNYKQFDVQYMSKVLKAGMAVIAEQT